MLFFIVILAFIVLTLLGLAVILGVTYQSWVDHVQKQKGGRP
jgi:hypothetical protein